MKLQPRAPQTADVRTYYEHPFWNRWTGRYTVEWDTPEGLARIRAHNRFHDFQGFCPSLSSLIRLPWVVSTYLAGRKSPLLKTPVPFLTVDAIGFLERCFRPGDRVLEIGGGNSTLWFLARGAKLTTVETSPEWAGRITEASREASKDRSTLDLQVLRGGAAIEWISGLPERSFQLVLIDCANEHLRRVDALAAARSKLVPGGWLVLDNSDHPNNWEAFEILPEAERIRFTGYAPMSLVVTQTSFWRAD